MATLIYSNGTRKEVNPKNGTNYELEELQAFVDGFIELVYLHNGQLLVVNEDGKDIYPVNSEATAIAHNHHAIFEMDYVCGDVLLCNDDDVR